MRLVRAKECLALTAALLLGLSLSACDAGKKPASDGDWRSQMKEIRIVVRGDEADPQQARRWDAYRAYLSKVSGLPVKTFEATDYNGVIQALSSGQVELAQMGGGSYANVDAQIGALATPILLARQAEGNTGYYSALMVRANSPYKTIQDLRGRSLAFVDFNSTSGFLYPRHQMQKEGINPDAFFGKTIMAGGHTQAVMALESGQ
jgi:phosphonate transport system substrate-binding protein